jgi:hypothetical protein
LSSHLGRNDLSHDPIKMNGSYQNDMYVIVNALSAHRVGWVERSETHQRQWRRTPEDGFRCEAGQEFNRAPMT